MAEDLSIRVRSMRYPESERPGNLVEDLDLTVPAQSIAAIVGPTGAGKTTLLRIIAGLERRFDGEVLLGGRTVDRPSRSIQIVFQDNRLLPWKSVADNLRFALRQGHSTSTDSSSLIARCLDDVHLGGKGERWPKTLSGGEEARVAFARAFIDPPKVLLLDEPFRSVDVRVRSQLQDELLRTLQAHPMTIVLVSHSVEDVVLLSDAVHLFSADPMTGTATFPISLSRPRDPSDPRLLEVTASITRHILGARSTSGA